MSTLSDKLPVATHQMVGEALDILIPVAKSDTHQSQRVAKFLLDWWDGKSPPLDFASVDRELGEAMATILLFLGQRSMEYADLWGRRDDMGDLVDRWCSPE
ncbi:DUF7673 family protein [Qipengyuania flava]|uniref:DUF7673 family protein n=1 Tax=Qipengyuania flava TaxID=192812 RepID=UPI001CD60063|nr:hypothetical protein [Qipengyuania flava]MCA0890494.1 hypothetical protein [Qipengyuania flava]